MKGLIWFRSDLRIDDNPALLSASNTCDELIGIYIFSKSQWALHNESAVKLEFLHKNLIHLEQSLQKLNIPLQVIETKNYDSLSLDLASFAKLHSVEHIYWNNEFGVNEGKRDLAVNNLLKDYGINSTSFDDQVIYEPGYLRTGQGKPFSVFTPFKRRWIENFSLDFMNLDKPTSPLKITQLNSDLSLLNFPKKHSVDMTLWPAGEISAHERLSSFLGKKVNSYNQSRNDPILDGTSRVSPYLTLGIISPKDVF